MLLLATLVLAPIVAVCGQLSPGEESRPGPLARCARAALSKAFVTVGAPLAGPLGYVVRDRSPVIGGAVVIALGEIGDQRSAHILRSAFQSASVDKRILICQALVKLDDRRSARFLLEASRHDRSPDVKLAASLALNDIFNAIGEDSLVATLERDHSGRSTAEALVLAHSGSAKALATVEEWLHIPLPGIGEYNLIRALADLEQPIAVRLLSSVTKDTACRLRPEAYYALSLADSTGGSTWLSQVLADPDPRVREAAMGTFANGQDSATTALLVAAVRDSTPAVRAKAISFLRSRPGVRDVVIAALDDTSAQVRGTAVRCLSFDTSAAATATLSSALKDRDPMIREAVLGGSEWPVRRRFGLSRLTAGLADSSRKVRLAAIDALRRRGDTAGVIPLTRVLVDTSRTVRLHAIAALGRLDDPRATPALIRMVHDPNPETRTGAVWALGRTGGPGAAEAVLRVLCEGVGDEQWWAAARLGRLQYGPAVTPLIDLLGDSYSRVRQVAAWALGRIGDTSAADALGRTIRGRDSPSEDVVAQALIQLGEPGILVLARLLRDSSSSVRRVAARAVGSAKLPSADSILLDAAERKDLVVVAEVYRYYLDRNDPALDRVLADAMVKRGTSNMWFALSRSGRPNLERAAARWRGPHTVGLSMGNDCLFVHEYDWQYFDYRD
jgi:HEAT repeat protein